MMLFQNSKFYTILYNIQYSVRLLYFLLKILVDEQLISQKNSDLFYSFSFDPCLASMFGR